MADFLPQATPSPQAKQGHEGNFIGLKSLVMFAVTLVGVTLFAQFALVYVMRDFSREEMVSKALTPPRFANDPGPFPDPKLQADPPVDLAKLKAIELRRLNGYGWVDRGAGIAHIPIDRAMAIVAATGLPVIPGAKTMDITEAAKPIKAVDKPAEAAPKPERKP